MQDEVKLPEWWTPKVIETLIAKWLRIAGTKDRSDWRWAIAEILRIEAEHRNGKPSQSLADLVEQELAGPGLDASCQYKPIDLADVWKSITRAREDFVIANRAMVDSLEKHRDRINTIGTHVDRHTEQIAKIHRRLAQAEHVETKVEAHCNTIHEMLERLDRLEAAAKEKA